jgi:arylsulfatase A-like enzyme
MAAAALRAFVGLGPALAAVLGAAPFAGAADPGSTAKGSSPGAVDSVLLITIDTLRADHVGAYGGPVPTPALDHLASQGVLVESAYTPTPSTGPAHASLLTGLHVWNHGALKNAVSLDPRIPTLADLLSDRGLDTAAFVSSYILHRRFGFHQGFATYTFEPSQPYHWRGKERERFWARGQQTTRAANRWLLEHVNRPFFLWVHYFDPHWPYRPPVGFAVSPRDPVDLTGKSIPRDQGVRNALHLKSLNRAYRGEVAYVDAQVGTLLERVKLLGLDDRTAVVLTADHGEGLGDHGVMEHGLHLYEELVQVPLILRAPSLPSGRRIAGPAQLEDLAPTILALLNVAPPESLDGVDLLPWLRGATDVPPRDAVVGARATNKGGARLFYVRDGSSKWIGEPGGPGLRFDLARDPGERDPQDGVAMPPRLEPAVAASQGGGAGAPSRGDADPEVRRALEALGYAE